MEQGTGGGRDGVRNQVTGNASIGMLIQTQSLGGLSVSGLTAGSGTDPAGGSDDPWVRQVAGSPVWQHVPSVRDTHRPRRQAAAVAAALGEARDRLEPLLADDPWRDPGVAGRFLERTELLLGDPADCPRPLDLYPAEASLLVLLPFLHRVHYLRLAARLRDGVRPWSLRPEAGAGPERHAFESFVGEGEALVQRALRNPEHEAQVGWWLFHRRLIQHAEFADAGQVLGLLDELGAPAAALGDVLTADRVSTLLQGLWRGPDVCHTEFLGRLAADEGIRAGAGHEQVREQRLMLIAALAYGMSVEMATLPEIVAEHLAVPQAVDLDELRVTLDGMHWGGPVDLRVLKASCHHEAVVEGVGAHVARADELLHAVRRTVRERITHPVPPLPTRLSADGVVPTGSAFDGYARFRSDGRRFRDLAMGIELYKDRDLAVRELYQNALDACRYRQARSRYLARKRPVPGEEEYAGQICFEQGVDEGGAYLRCTDNGVGMGESELRGVFAQAGARFAEQLEFKQERAAWREVEPPVTLSPNSRFGIGVLSYFMLADEITVETCRMGPDGRLGPDYRVSIYGPGHLFRIHRETEAGRKPGTTITLRLRPDVVPDHWSSVAVLKRLLAIAEFDTTATESGGRTERWPAGELRERSGRFGRPAELRYVAHGWLRPWREAPEGVDVVWCEDGGALLVDGLVVEPKVRSGVLASGGGGPRGVVVNLSGQWSPERLSVDRRHVLDDVAPLVRKLLEQAAGVLAEGAPPSFEWLCAVAQHSTALGDLAVGAVLAGGGDVSYRGMRFGADGTGFFPADATLFPDEPTGRWYDSYPDLSKPRNVPDHVYLWRLLARRPAGPLEAVARICPEVLTAGPVREAILSDQVLLLTTEGPESLRQVAELAVDFGTDSRQVAHRLTGLGFPFDPRDWDPDARLTPDDAVAFESGYDKQRPLTPTQLMNVTQRRDVAAIAATIRRFGYQVPEEVVRLVEAAQREPVLWHDPAQRYQGMIRVDVPVPAGHLVRAGLALGLPVREVRRRLEAHGLRVDTGPLPDRPSHETALLLSRDGDGRPPWLDRTGPPPPGQVLRAAEELGITPGEVCARLTDLGFVPPAPLPADASPADLDVLCRPHLCLDPGDPLRFDHVLDDATGLEHVRERITRLRAYGFTVPLVVPARPNLLDQEVLGPESPLRWWFGSTIGEPVPLAHVLVAAERLRTTPAVLTRRLRSYGVRVRPEALPAGLSAGEALRLVSSDELARDEAPDVEDFTLHYLHRVAHRTGRSITETASLIRQLGVAVPDPAETVRAALARVPRP
ncbi:ATP-binding protein [Streptomyces sp. NPDC012888]|uniref:wHTH domain-containing protein n=1 Tax=Streptomyces sp. NPDC012888 TaxID=3364855 RepID=UPI00367A18BC